MKSLSFILALEPTQFWRQYIFPFAILLLVILVVHKVVEKLKLPGLVALVTAGIALGSSGWHLLESSSPMISLLSNIGLDYLIFITALEFDLQLFRYDKLPVLIFTIFTLILSLTGGILLGKFLNLSHINSIFIGISIAAYTPLAYPLISGWGVLKSHAVKVTMTASLITNLASLIILVLCIKFDHFPNFEINYLISKLIGIAIYLLLILVGLNFLGQEFFKHIGDYDDRKFVFVILSIFISVLGAELIGIEKILGLFLAGLAINATLGDGAVKEKLLFIGNVVFIPIFFVCLGLKIDVNTIINNHQIITLAILMFFSLFITKFIAALFTKLFYRYQWTETLMMWSLSIPVVGIILTVAMEGLRVGLLSTELFYSMIILMLMTSVFSLWLTSKLGLCLTNTFVNQSVNQSININLFVPQQKLENENFTVIVPLYNPQNQQNLMEMAALLSKPCQGKVIPLAIAHATAKMNTKNLSIAYQRCELLLAKAMSQSRFLGINIEPLIRIDDNYAPAIVRAAREQKANLIIMGWGKRDGLRQRLFGSLINDVLWSAHCPVVVARLVDSPKRIRRILLPIENLLRPRLETINFAQKLADANQAHLTLLNVCINETRNFPGILPSRKLSNSDDQIKSRRSYIYKLLSPLSLSILPEVQVITHDNLPQAILQAARLYDLVIFPFTRQHNSPGSLPINDLTTQLTKQLTCSVIILAEPQYPNITVSQMDLSIINPQKLNFTSS
ncbi:cation:proton antiporter [Anabaena sp. FACHB-1237]|uniref:cation:proton antiporter n=1 Tax=Anabaena sp. FACHB-1237 TaxID=2692769 RepID=UPI001680F855|nr:cation:proton antiporter [Anabaena sp. FACHB-1237]MBD2138654.1 cation:proton antiporter [Anabaena sp. FACHB-1237]